MTRSNYWQYEDEVRMFVGLDQNAMERGAYFLGFSEQLALREVILGPLCEIPIGAVCALVGNLYQGINVIKAELAYKWYKVVPGPKQYKVKGAGADSGAE